MRQAAASSPLSSILYVVGHPRCGSTIVGNVLAEIPGVFHAGELHYLWTPSLPLPRQLCGCGEQVRRCELWRRIFADAFETSDAGLPAEADVAAAPAWGLPGVDATEVYHLQRRALASPRRSAQSAEAYLRVMARLYQAIARVTGCRVVVDSSKWPHDARLLAGIDGVDLSFIHLVREPWGAVYSRLPRARPDLPASAGPPSRFRVLLESTRWLRSNVMAELVARRSGRRWQVVRYEDFVAEPADTAGRLAALAGLDPEAVSVDVHQVHLTINHTTGGNRNRWQHGKVEIRHDRRWRQGLRRSDVQLVSVMTWPYRLRYDYTL
jgi:hypothetical protein